MKTLYDIENLGEIISRIERINPDTQALWGKMNAAQMLEHCARALDFATGKTGKKPRMIIGYILGGLFKPMYYNDKPWARSTKTAPMYVVADTPHFEKSKQRLINLAKEFGLGGPQKCTPHPSPFFGHLTPEQHGLGQYKHLDHHLKQFGLLPVNESNS